MQFLDFTFTETAITSLLIPAQLTNISSGAFYKCEQLKIIEIHEDLRIYLNFKKLLKYSEKVIIMIPTKLKDHFIKTDDIEVSL